MAKHSMNIADLKTDLHSFKNKVEANVKQLEAKLETIETKLGIVETKLETVETKLETFEAYVKTALGSINASLQALAIGQHEVLASSVSIHFGKCSIGCGTLAYSGVLRRAVVLTAAHVVARPEDNCSKVPIVRSSAANGGALARVNLGILPSWISSQING
jgi:hypothetical protein